MSEWTMVVLIPAAFGGVLLINHLMTRRVSPRHSHGGDGSSSDGTSSFYGSSDGCDSGRSLLRNHQ